MTAADDREVTPARSVPLATKTWDIQPLLAAAEARGVERGYRRAVDRLRDDERYRNWWSQLPPDHPEARYWDFGRQQLADYLEAVEGDDRADTQ